MPKAVRFYKLGGPEVLQIEEVQVWHPEAGEVAINVPAVCLNRAESMYCHGNYSQQPEFPSGLGYEAVGTVTAVGEGVGSFRTHRQTDRNIPGYSMNRYPVLDEKAVVRAYEGLLIAENRTAHSQVSSSGRAQWKSCDFILISPTFKTWTCVTFTEITLS